MKLQLFSFSDVFGPSRWICPSGCAKCKFEGSIYRFIIFKCFTIFFNVYIMAISQSNMKKVRALCFLQLLKLEKKSGLTEGSKLVCLLQNGHILGIIFKKYHVCQRALTPPAIHPGITIWG